MADTEKLSLSWVGGFVGWAAAHPTVEPQVLAKCHSLDFKRNGASRAVLLQLQGFSKTSSPGSLRFSAKVSVIFKLPWTNSQPVVR